MDAPADWQVGWRQLMEGNEQAVCWQTTQRRMVWGEEARQLRRRTRWVLPGSFNPVHEGHLKMAAWIRQRAPSRRAAFACELSVTNVDKPALTRREAWRRMERFGMGHTIWLTRAPTFEEKSQLFGPVTFVVGADTIRRVASPKYYDYGTAGRQAAVAQIAALRCRFLVFGRLLEAESAGESQFVADAQTCQLPGELAAVCDWVSADEFRVDLSSTELRARRKGPPPG